MFRHRFGWVIAVALFVGGCASSETTTEGANAGAAASPADISPGARQLRETQAQNLFLAWCAGCHGARGRGDGPGATAITPPPRNFSAEKFKIRSTASGQPPTRRDIFDTITRGLAGTPMPSFAFLSEQDRWQLADRVRTFAGLEATADPPVVALGEPPPETPEAARRGREVYARTGCAHCHGETGRGDGPSSATLLDDQGRPIPARDYTKGLFLGGDSAQALHQRFRTGMDGTGMPAFGPELSAQDGWNLVYYMRSLRAPAAPVPTDAVAYGRRIVQERQCSACHVIEGRGGDVGPNLDVSATKLHYNWVREFLADPLSFGKVYPYMPYRMPNLNLSAAEIDAIVALFAQIARRPLPEPPDPPARIDESRIADGTLLYFLKCTECHNLGTVVPTPEAKRQGPDLINVSRRLRFEFIRGWVNNPRSINPLARMVDTNLTPEEIEAVTAFVWKTSTEAQARAARR